MENTAKRFTNFSDEKFSWNWGKEPYTVDAGETILLPTYLADHLAKHLIDRELGKIGIPVDRKDERERMEKLAFGSVIIEATSPEKLEVAMMNDEETKKEEEKEVKEVEKSKKEKKTWKKKSKDEEEFEG